MNMTRRTDVETLQSRLCADTDRWAAELDGTGSRPTLSIGVQKRAYSHAEGLLKACSRVFVVAGGAEDLVRVVSENKFDDVDRLTLGQCVNLLEMLDKRKLIADRGKALGKADRHLLSRITSVRNGFIHGGTAAGADDSDLADTLRDVRQLGDLRLVMLAVQRESATAESPVS